MANYFNNMLPENTRTSNYKNKYGMYQYTSSKTISGWSGKLDHNVCYKDYPAIVKQYGFNGYGAGSGSSSTEKVTEKVTEKATTAEVVANKYAVTDAIKKVKEHIGSAISEYAIDGAKVKETESFSLAAGQTFSIKGYAGFTTAIKDFGYYFDDDVENAVWNFKGETANASTKKKAGDKAKTFEITADTSSLTAGKHTLTYMVKLSSKECELITVELEVTGGESGSESSGEFGGSCGMVVSGSVILIAFTSIGGAALMLKKKKED